MTISIICDYNKVGIHEGDSKFYRISVFTITTGVNSHSFFVTQYGAIPDKLRPTLNDWFCRPESEKLFSIFAGYGRVDYESHGAFGEAAVFRCKKQAADKLLDKSKRGYRFKDAGKQTWHIEDSQLRELFSGGVDPISLTKLKSFVEPHSMLSSTKTVHLAEEFLNVFMATVVKIVGESPKGSESPESLSSLIMGTVGSATPVIEDAPPVKRHSVLWGTW